MLRLLCLLVGLAATVNGACDTPFHQVGEGCYYFSLEYNLQMSWTESRQYCQGMGSGVDLAVMDYLCDDYRHLENYLLMADAFLTLDDMHVGATGSGESWFWVDGRALSVSSSHWYYTFPTSTSGCVALLDYTLNGYERIHLHTHDCSFLRYFVCQTNVTARQ